MADHLGDDDLVTLTFPAISSGASSSQLIPAEGSRLAVTNSAEKPTSFVSVDMLDASASSSDPAAMPAAFIDIGYSLQGSKKQLLVGITGIVNRGEVCLVLVPLAFSNGCNYTIQPAQQRELLVNAKPFHRFAQSWDQVAPARRRFSTFCRGASNRLRAP